MRTVDPSKTAQNPAVAPNRRSAASKTRTSAQALAAGRGLDRPPQGVVQQASGVDTGHEATQDPVEVLGLRLLAHGSVSVGPTATLSPETPCSSPATGQPIPLAQAEIGRRMV